MKLRRIDIHGFKSFRAKTSLEIADGVTVVVGPNGCGKSNIVDSIRWAIGSQSPKDLRGRAMEDVIFAGSENHRPMGYAEVSLTLENDGKSDIPVEWRQHAEIKLSRRLFRTGESEYEINGAKVRLRDIHELFLGTGVGAKEAYSIIEQGRIGFIVSSRPEERRVLIEEAAGITRYKFQRKTAERRLDKTKDNLSRVKDILDEVGRQLSSLERQAKRAAKWRELSTRTRQLELCGLLFRRDAYAEEGAKLALAMAERVAASEGAAAGLATLEARVETLGVTLAAREQSLDEATDAAYRAKSRADILKNNVGHHERELVSLAERKSAAIEQADEAGAALVRNREDLALHSATLRDQEAALSESATAVAAAQSALQAARASEHAVAAENDTLSRKLTEERGKMARTAARAESLAAERDRLAERSDGVKRDLLASQATATAAAAAAELATAAEQRAADAASKALQSRDELVAAEREALHSSQVSQRAQREAAKTEQSAAARVEGLQAALSAGEGYGDGVRAVIAARESGELGGIGRPLAERLRVAEAHEARLSAVLGPWLGAVCVEDDAALQAVSAWARRRDQSVAVLSLSEPTTEIPCDWCTASDAVPAWIATRLGTVSVVSDAARAERTPAVDDEGGAMKMPGALSLGRPDAAVSALSLSRRVDDAKAEHAAAVDAAASASALATAGEHALEEALARRVTAAKVAEDAQALAASARREAMNARQEADRTAARAQYAEREATAQAKRDDELAAALAELASERDQAADAVRVLGDQLDALESKLDQARRAARESADAFAASSSEEARIRERARSAKETVARLENLIRESEQRGARLGEQLKEIEDRRLHVDAQLVEDRRTLGASIQRADQTERTQAEARAAYDQATTKRREAEAELHAARQVAHKAEQALREVELRVTRVQTDLEHAETSIVERYGVTLEGAREEAAGLTWTDELRDEAAVLSGRLERLGPVNPAAEEEFEEANSRHEYLREQREDLELAMADLESAIRKMDKTSRELFEEMFEKVNERFQVIYPRLFRGGKARLELTDPDDMLHTGVEIVCQPPGKRLQSMSLMSGGEKALTAVALIFAIFQLKPTPFCILDEVDAPLDDANVSRFSGMVEEMSATSQFLIITHNKTTMEAARTLYGVTMQEPGVSNVVGVRMHEQELEASV